MDILIDKITAKHFEMKYLRFGRGKKKLVIIPGLSVQSVLGYAKQIAAEYAVMADEFTAYIFDIRLDLPKVYSIKDMAEDIVYAIRSVDLNEIYLLGVSMGGMVALEIAIRYPDIVKKLAIGSTTPKIGDSLSPVLKRWVSLAEEKDKKGLYLDFGEKIYPPAVFGRYKVALIAASKTVTDDDLIRFVTLVNGMIGFDVTDRLQMIKCPVLAIGSYDDMVIKPEMTAIIAEKLGAREDFEMFMYDGFGHAAYDTAPDYRERLYKFFMKR